MSDYKFINREISWLQFNERVLREAEDDSVPLLEKLKYLAIFSSNLDEFFMIRVAGLYNQIEANYATKDASGHTPRELVTKLSEVAHKLVKEQQKIFRKLIKECAKHHIVIDPEIDGELSDVVDSIFNDEILPIISPVTLSHANPFPFIYNLRQSIFVKLEKDGQTHYSIIIIPENLRRVFKVRLHRTYCLTSEAIITNHLARIYPGYKVVDSYMLRLTRNGDLTVDQDDAGDLLKTIEKKLPSRKKGSVVRVELDKTAPDEVLKFLQEQINFDDEDVYIVNRPLDLTFLFSIIDLNDELVYPEHKPFVPYGLKADEHIFDKLKERDYMFYRPYHDFSFNAALIRRAAIDEQVLAIKMTLYRANKGSSIVESLAEAARRGKQVCVVIELKARFDEERNVGWAKKLEEAGCIVTYGIAGLKIHAKNLLIVRKEPQGIVRYSYLSTGNFNEATAQIYTDIDYITADEEVGRECANLFNTIMGYTEYADWNRLSLAPNHLKRKILSLIDFEIEQAQAGKKAEMIIKVNSLIDNELIMKLHDASRAGVKIDMIIRGVCGMTAGVKGLTENISIRSIVGRFLEHPRILCFHNAGKKRLFISTADWMERNMHNRVEHLFEITDKNGKDFLMTILNSNLKDNVKAWVLEGETYRKLKPAEGEAPHNTQEFFIGKQIGL
jgi:polyphosphate kinase